jgi:microcystin-dependent protein
MHVPVVDNVPECDDRARPQIGAGYHGARMGRAGGGYKMDQFVGQIAAVGFNFAPAGWVLCNGQLLPISQFNVLFNLLGTTFGGDGQSTFGVPNLQGRSPLGQGTGLGLPPATLGQASGSENVTLTSTQIATHTHQLMASSGTGTLSKPTPTSALANQANGDVQMYAAAPGTVTLAPAAIGAAGGSQPHENRQPFNTVNYIIATVGIFPSQS